MERFGKYQVVEKIGLGGFGVIYKGHDPVIKRAVAIKTCITDDADARGRFTREAEIVGNLHHRNITIIYDFGLEDGIPYLVQEYLGGEDLDRKIKGREYLPFATKLLYLVQVARGLEYAHSQGVVHRDIKPANIRVLEDETIKIMDFGIAKLATAQTRLTQTGQTLGTAAYLSPEQIRGDPVDERADIFSYGLLAYELLTYQRPFRASNPSAVLYQILTEEPRPMSELWPQCPAEMEKIVGRCLRKTPAARYPHCGELLGDLEQLVRNQRSHRSVEAMPPPPPVSSPASAADTPAGGGEGRSPRTLGLPAEAEQEDARFSTLDASQKTLEMRPTSIDQVDLKPDRKAAGRPAPFIPKPPPPQPKSHGGAWLLAVAILLGLGAGGWWSWQKFEPWPRLLEMISSQGSALSAAAGEDDSPVPDPSSAAADSGAAVDVGSPGQTQGSELPVREEAPRGTLVLPQAWNPEMTVSINGGRSLRLDRRRTLQLAPGRYSLSFDLITRSYHTTGQNEIRLREGQTRTARIAIPRPGRLTVRQNLGSAQGWVICNGESLGWSPIEGRELPAGELRLVISAGPEADVQDGLRENLTLRSNRELVVTFDLGRRRRPQVVERGLDGS